MPRIAVQVKEPSQAQLAARAAGAERMRAINQARAAGGKVLSVRPVRSTRQFMEAAEQQVGQDRPRTMKSRGPARKSLEPVHIERVDGPVSKDKLAMLAFMEEPVKVMVHDTTDPTVMPIPQVRNGEASQFFIRGQEQVVKRKFVEILARAKKTTRGNEKFVDGNGDDSYRYPAHSALLYPFSVIEDSQKGKDWLRKILAEA